MKTDETQIYTDSEDEAFMFDLVPAEIKQDANL